jgi:hypothetical protein
VRWFCEGRLRLEDGRVQVRGARPDAGALISPATEAG